jgi:lysyl-tRNA synthetase class 2
MYQFDGLDPFEARRAKLQAWRDLGVDPFPARTPAHEDISVARAHGSGLSGEERLEGSVAISGRVMSLRGQGGLMFADLHDRTGKLQLLLKSDILSPELFEQLQLLDLGDFIWVSGALIVTKRGELTVEVKEWKLLTKALRPLPDSWNGLQDIEQRQRQRYVDLLVNPNVKERFKKRSQFVSAIRQFLSDRQFLEVETPILEHIPGGADAEPFMTHHNALDVDFYLRISLELHLKRLVVGGMERVYELGRTFRNEGVSPQHLQEFTMLEFYWAYASYEELMTFVEELYCSAIQATFGTLQIQRGETTLHFEGPWPRVSYVQLLKDYAGVDILTASDEELVEHIKKHRVDTDVSLGRGRLLDQLYKKTVRPHLIQPQFIVDVPVEFSPLAKRKAEDPRLTERIMVLIDGAEVGNGFSELNDPIDQRERFEVQEQLRLKGDAEAQRKDEDFLRALEYGMPPTTGFGVGIDRLLSILLDVDTVRETVFFPTMRPEHIADASSNPVEHGATPQS